MDGVTSREVAVLKLLLKPPDILIALAVYVYCWRKVPDGWASTLLMVLAGMGFAGWILARVQLGRSFTFRAQARELVTTGLYSKIQNPIYVFSTAGLLCMVLAMHWYRWGLPYVALVIAMQWRRARREARVLGAEFGEGYEAYRTRTWF